ncbi:MAG: hypothetical protein WA634_05050 [Silvibacterium sp.]
MSLADEAVSNETGSQTPVSKKAISGLFTVEVFVAREPGLFSSNAADCLTADRFLADSLIS